MLPSCDEFKGFNREQPSSYVFLTIIEVRDQGIGQGIFFSNTIFLVISAKENSTRAWVNHIFLNSLFGLSVHDLKKTNFLLIEALKAMKKKT